jgi:tyrosyl-tRNA synthetase
MEKHINLQMFADDTGAADAATGTAENTQNEEAAADQSAENKDQKSADKKKPKYTDEDLDEIIGRRLARWQEKQQKAVDEAKKLAEMDATQKAEYERDQLKKELAELKRKSALSDMTKEARRMLSSEGVNIPDELLALMVTTEAEETKAAIDGFAKAFKEAVESAVRERLKGEPPRRGSGGAASMTREQIAAIKDPELRQKKMLENRHLYNI